MKTQSILLFIGIALSLLNGCSASRETSKSDTSKQSPGYLQKLLDEASWFVKTDRSVVRKSKFDFTKLKKEDLSELYFKLKENNTDHPIQKKLLFEARDQLIRFASKDPNFTTSLNSRFSSDPILGVLDFNQTYFHQFTFKAGSFLAHGAITVSTQAPEVKSLRPINVLHASFEAPNASVGGYGAYLSGLTSAEIHHVDKHGTPDIHAMIVTPFYDFLKKKYFEKVRFQGFIQHEVDGRVNRSSVYELQDSGLTQLLIQPDPDYVGFQQDGDIRQGWDIFDVQEPSNLYSKAVYNNIGLVYFPSAVASLATLYSDPSGNGIDVLQLNGRHLALTSALMRLHLNPKRDQAGLPKVGVFATTHDTLEYDFQLHSELLRRAGLRIQKDYYNPHVLLNVMSESSTTVSKSLALAMTETRPGLDMGLGKLFFGLKSVESFVGINNGIYIKSFDPRNSEILDSLAVDKNFENLADKKSEAKKTLFNHGLIGSPNKLLFLYVGRVSSEKGIDLLEEFSKYVVKNKDAQMVIMGSVAGLSPIEVIQIKKLVADSSYGGLIKLYLNREVDQEQKLSSIPISKGYLIRFAADFTLVPSIFEASGLVPIESLAMGSGVITSNVQGIKDTCTQPWNADGSNVENFNCVAFERQNTIEASQFSLFKVVDRFLDYWNRLSTSQQTDLKIHWIQEAQKFDWNYPGGSLDDYLALYRTLIKTHHDVKSTVRADWIQDYIGPLE